MDDFARANALLDAGEGEKAMPIFLQCAEQGKLAAMHAMAHTYLYGLAGVKQDYDKAFAWFTRGANNGCPQAMYHLGLCNAKGYGTPVNDELSASWYRRSAECGDADAMYEVGLCYETGRGVEQNLVEARQWYEKAANNGQQQAAEKLRDI